MNKTIKYSFETEFTRDSRDKEIIHASNSTRRYSDVDIEALKQAAYEEGREAGSQDAIAAATSEAAQSAAKLFEHAQSILQSLESESEKYRSQAASLALLIARKLASALIAREPEVEIENLIAQVLSKLPTEPRIVVRLSEANVDAIKEHVERLSAEAGFEGKVILLGDPEMEQAFCAIEWADGGLEWDTAQLQADTETAVMNYFNALNTMDMETNPGQN